MKNNLIVVRGGGDLATGVIHTLWAAGLKVLVLEIAYPAAIRRQVSLCECVYQGEATVEDFTAVLIHDISEMEAVWAVKKVPVLVDPEGTHRIKPSTIDLIDNEIVSKEFHFNTK